MNRPLRIAIATGGRFHVLDLARELASLGHEVAFYSYVPQSRAVRFGLPAACHRGLFGRAMPFLMLRRAVRNGRLARMIDYRLTVAMDRAVARVMEPCDFFIGMSGLYLEAGRAAQEKFGARFVLERGSRHILSQKEILDAMPGRGAAGAWSPIIRSRGSWLVMRPRM